METSVDVVMESGESRPRRPSTRQGRDEWSAARKKLKTTAEETRKDVNMLSRELAAKHCSVEQALETKYITQINALKEELAYEKIRALGVRSARAAAAVAEQKANLHLEEAINFRVMMNPTFGKSDLKCADETLARRDRMIQARDAKLEALQQQVRTLTMTNERFSVELTAQTDMASKAAELRDENSRLKSKCEQHVISIKRLAGAKGGRPIMHRSESDLNELETHTAQEWGRNAAQRIRDVIGTVGSDSEISIHIITNALKLSGYLPGLWETEEVWGLRMEWAAELREHLQLVWSPELTRRLRDKLNLSYDEVDELRYNFSHNRVGKQLRPRPWIIDPWTNKRVKFPEPMAHRGQWTPLIKQFIESRGLTRDAQGRIAQRSYLSTLHRQVERDRCRDWLAADEPLKPTLGADGTCVGKVGFMHVTSDISASYKDGIAQQNEMSVCTIAAAQTDDHWGGLDEVLCGGYHSGKVETLSPNCIASEFNSLIDSGKLDDKTCTPVGCFDLAAARGIRGGRGKCACHCTCLTATDRHSIPQSLSAKDTSGVTWAEVAKDLSEHGLLDHATMMNDSHTPPEDWDWSQPWRCSRPGCGVVFQSRAEFVMRRKQALAEQQDKSVEGKKKKAAKEQPKQQPT
jgi:hypothetical protein